MDATFKFALPSPNFDKNARDAIKSKPHYLTPSGMSLLPRDKQPPPMYGKHGTTLPARYLAKHVGNDEQFVKSAIPSENQYCEPCELELHSLEDLKRHRSQHEKCPVAGCLYKGHPSVMDKHISTLHSSGLFDKFKKLSTPEEIAAWREERRKRYPTVANVLLKQKAKEQRQKRGERLESKRNRFGNLNDRKRAQCKTQEDKSHAGEKRHQGEKKSWLNNKRDRKNKHKNAKNQQLKPKIQKDQKTDNEKLKVEAEDNCEIKMFRGTSYLENYKHFNDKSVAVTQNPLFSLVGMYGSDDDESEENNSDYEDNIGKIETVLATETNESNTNSYSAEQPSEQQDSIEFIKTDGIDKFERLVDNSRPLKTSPIEKIIESNNNEGIEDGTLKKPDNSSDEAPEETFIQRSIPDYPSKSVNNNIITSFEKTELKRIHKTKKQFTKRKYGLDYRKARLRKQNTMLEKLLESDIRHERNVLLQCVRYVCENNFFNTDQNKNN